MSSSIQSQKDAVYSAIASVLAENNIQVAEGESLSSQLNREVRAQVVNVLVEGFNAGTIKLESTYDTQAELRAYCSSVISNWLRKDTRLNGGVKYVAKNQGTRTGAGDASLKAMRLLLQSKEDPSERAEIQAFIDKRVAEFKAARKPAKVIDTSAIPSELQHLVG